jgi:hypothetical protein
VDRHPAAAVTAGLFTLVWMSMMLSVYPIAALTMIGLAGVSVAAYRTARNRQHREALVTRADWEHRALMARPLPQLPAAIVPHRRAADHSSRTEPMVKSSRG